ncbi:MAG: type IV pilus secretin PilQ [Deltaproteobacteria bacterium]|nr:type IV pilus secretin PilQ [Deltaproteobacteria bacterium]
MKRQWSVISSQLSVDKRKTAFENILHLASCILILMSLTVACSPKASQVRPEEPVTAVSIDKIEVSEVDGRSLLTIKSTAAMQGNYTIVKISGPPTVVIEMPNVEPANFGGPIEVNDGTIGRIETSRMDGKGTRLEVFLSALTEHEVKVNGNSLELYFVKVPKVVEAPQVETSLQEQKIEAAPPVEEEAAAPAVVEEPKKIEKPKKTLKIINVKIKRLGKYTTAEIITNGEPTAYNAFSLKAPNRVVLDIGNAREILSKKDIKVVSPHIKGARLGRYDDKVRVVFDYKGEVKPYDVVKGKDRIVIFFGRKPTVTIVRVEKPKVKVKVEAAKEEVKAEVKVEEKQPPVKEEKAEAKEEIKVEAKEEVRVEVEKKEEAQQAEVKVEEKPASVKEEKAEVAPEKKIAEEAPNEPGAKFYTGQKVVLEFKDADIKNIFRIIAEVSGYNMVIDSAVTGKLTLRLINVPWDQALDIILDTNNLGMTKIGNVIRVMPKAAIKKEEEEKLASLKAKEKLEDMVTKLIPVSYAKASDLSSKLKGVMTDRGTTLVDERTNTIILKDIQKSVDAAEKLVKDLDTPTAQVSIEARLVSANTSFSRDLGIQWGSGYTASASTGNPTGYYFPNSYTIAAGGGGSVAANLPTTGNVGGPGGSIGISFGSINNTLNLDLRLSALETQGWGKVISSPKVITLDNKEATIQQGYSIPFETTSASGTQTSFIDANLNLTVTPHVTADGRILMKVKTSNNKPDNTFKGASGAPSIFKNEATTEVLVKDGETTVIGGIYETTKTESESYTPLLGKIPIIGWLFKSKTKTDVKTELLIFITPRIVHEKAM